MTSPMACARRFLQGWRRPLGGLALILGAGTVPCGWAVPPASETSFSTSWASPSHMFSSGSPTTNISTREFSLSVLARRALPWKDWYLGAGLGAEDYQFSGTGFWPRRLQAYYAPVKLDYYQADQPVFEFSLQPGFYYEKQFTSQSWDMPVQVVSGIPLTATLHGVVGMGRARYYHHSLPIIGLIYEQSPRLRWEAVFPEPAVIFTPQPGWEWRLGGELTGNGFLSGGRLHRTVVEYSSYHVGLTATRTWQPGRKWSFGGGYQAAKTFDYFHLRTRSHSAPAFYLEAGIALSP